MLWYFVSFTKPTIRFSCAGLDGVASRQKRAPIGICSQPKLFGECLVHDRHTRGLRRVVVIEIASGEDRNAQRLEVVRADAAEIRLLPSG